MAFWEVGAAYTVFDITSRSSLLQYNENLKHGIDPFMELRIMK